MNIEGLALSAVARRRQRPEYNLIFGRKPPDVGAWLWERSGGGSEAWSQSRVELIRWYPALWACLSQEKVENGLVVVRSHSCYYTSQR